MLGRDVMRAMCAALGGNQQATSSPYILAALAAIGSSFPLVPAMAQSEAPPWAQGLAQLEASTGTSSADIRPPACFIEPAPINAETASRADSSGAPTILMARCSGTGVLLGEADDYSFSYNPSSGAIVVNIERSGRTRVMLMQRDEEGLSVEDITGDISVAVGRSPTDGLRGVATDFARFGREGVITVSDDGADVAGQARGAQRRPAFAVADHNSRRRAVTATARTANAGGGQ